ALGAGSTRACQVECFLFRAFGTVGDKPGFMLTNVSHMANILDFQLTIGDTAYNFDLTTNEQASPGVSYTLLSPDHVVGGVRSDLIHYQFNGQGMAYLQTFNFHSEINQDKN